MRELKQPRRGKTSVDMHMLARLLDLPEDLEPVSLHVVHDPDAVVLVFEGDRLADNVLNRYIDTQSPYYGVHDHATTREDGLIERRVTWNGLPELPTPPSARDTALERIATFGAPSTPDGYRQTLVDLGLTPDEVDRVMKARFEPSDSTVVDQ